MLNAKARHTDTPLVYEYANIYICVRMHVFCICKKRNENHQRCKIQWTVWIFAWNMDVFSWICNQKMKQNNMSYFGVLHNWRFDKNSSEKRTLRNMRLDNDNFGYQILLSSSFLCIIAVCCSLPFSVNTGKMCVICACLYVCALVAWLQFNRYKVWKKVPIRDMNCTTKSIPNMICKYLSAFHLTFFTVCCARSLSLFLISVSFPLYKCHEHAETEDVDALIYTLYAHLRPHISFCTHLVRKLFAHYTVDSECDWEWVEHGPKSIHLVNMHIYTHTHRHITII